MKLARVETWSEAVPLTRPYTIATRTVSDVELFFVRLTTRNGTTGLGSAAPAEDVTGESYDACRAALREDALAPLLDRDVRELNTLCRELLRSHQGTPAARVAVEMALHDLAARALERPLVDLFGRCHRSLPTSITIGIKETIEESLEEAEEYLGRGFRALKVKIGHSFDQESELLSRLREKVGRSVQIRVDANLGYSRQETEDLWPLAENLDLELIEQPVAVQEFPALDVLPDAYRQRLAADESLVRERDALRLAGEPHVCGIFNIKLMKCGGLTSARSIARIAELGDQRLMWGCMDESVISISAALHTAYACPNTRFLDLDGSFDLARDPARGGFRLIDGHLHLLDAPGLGVELSA